MSNSGQLQFQVKNANVTITLPNKSHQTIVSQLLHASASPSYLFKNYNKKIRAPAVAGFEELLQAMGDTI